ncbi:MAG: DedA family protein [Muribaculaceae bacterium]|nr:DedA family protein [Muribaculaceae bacterium]
MEFLIQWGYAGLCLSAFIAGSVLPLSSELVLSACILKLHLSPWWCLVWATVGNVGGGMTCYWLGSLGKMEWIERYAHVSREKLVRTQRWVEQRGAWMAFFAFLPILGSAIMVALGLLRANKGIVLLAMTIGKVLRYGLLILGILGVMRIL